MSFCPQANVGIYVDWANIQTNGGYGMQYDVLREYACHDDGVAVRLNAYVTLDEERANEDRAYGAGISRYFAVLRDFGFKVIVKKYKWYKDEEGNAYAKANADLDMAVDALLQSENLGRVVLATGDGDFVQVVRALQNKGCRVEVLAFDNVSSELRREADEFTSGYLVPNLLPTRSNFGKGKPWGEEGSRVRGTCYHRSAEGYGFLRFLKNVKGNFWITDSRHPDSPYQSVFFHDSDLPDELNPASLPSHDIVLEFDLIKSPVKAGALQATSIHVVRGDAGRSNHRGQIGPRIRDISASE
jgi:uncharacterized LabA/DUF88 family protein